MDKRRSEGIISSPDSVELTKTQLKHLANLTKLNPQQIGEGTVAQISERLTSYVLGGLWIPRYSGLSKFVGMW